MNKVNQLYMAVKQASMEADVAGNVLGSSLTGGMSGLIGGLHGFVAEGDELNVPNNSLGLVPGVGSSRMVRRARNVRKDLAPEAASQRGRLVSELISPVTSTLANTGLGMAAGAVLDGRRGAAVGGMVGVWAGLAKNLASMLLAASTRRRTKEEQVEAEKSSSLYAHVIPGRGIYDFLKRVGYSGNYDKGSPNKG